MSVTKHTTITGPLAEIKTGLLTSFESINLQKVPTVIFMERSIFKLKRDYIKTLNGHKD